MCFEASLANGEASGCDLLIYVCKINDGCTSLFFAGVFLNVNARMSRFASHKVA